jgi:2-dehydro-3-deoxygluconokinase
VELVSAMGGIVSFGECMIELSRAADGSTRVGYGGDTLNTAIYLARLGHKVAYLTAVGIDSWSADMVQRWQGEGIDCSLVTSHATRAAGLYAISTGAGGERSFTYWREMSAARAFFETEGAEAALAQAEQAEVLYLSGITLAIFGAPERRRIVKLARDVRASGGVVAFDPNWRPRLWADAAAFQDAASLLAPAISLALPSFDDEAAVWGDAAPEDTLARWRALGAGDVVVKHGAVGALTSEGWVAGEAVAALDTTGAGDSFNAGYIALRRAGASARAAARFAGELAARVVQHAGAIMPAEAMPPLPPLSATGQAA